MRFLPTSALLLIAISCAPAHPERPPVQTVRVVDGTGGRIELTTTAGSPALEATVPRQADDVWDALPAIYEALGIPLTDRDRPNRTIGNAGLRARRQLGGVRLSQYLDCGRAQEGPSADTYEVQLAVQTRVEPADGGSSVIRTRVQANARSLTFSSSPVQCASTGRLEERIVERIRDLAGPAI